MEQRIRTILTTLAALIATTIMAATAKAQTNSTPRIVKTYMVDNFFKAQCEYLASDTTVKDGHYTLSYRGTVIEDGYYSNGHKVGEWQFWNLQKLVELKFDFTQKQPTYILPHYGHDYDQLNYPCIFLGSPLVPFYYITNRVYFPKSEGMKNKSGKVVLRLHINSKGWVVSTSIKSATSEAFASVVRKAANDIPKDKWRWVPARSNGKRVSDNYDITIMFEND